MAQTRFNLRSTLGVRRQDPEFAEAVGLTFGNDVFTFRFVGDKRWGQGTRQVTIDRHLAEQLTRLLNDELETADWSV